MKREKKKEKKEENYIKKGRKGLKNASFWAINSKNRPLPSKLWIFLPAPRNCHGIKLNEGLSD